MSFVNIFQPGPAKRSKRSRQSATLGFTVTTVSIALALIPAEDEPNKLLAVTKVAGLTILLVASGALVYFLGTRRGHDR